MAEASGGPFAHNAITPCTIIMHNSPGGHQALQAHLTTFCSAKQLSESKNPHAPPVSTTSSLSRALAADVGYAATEALKGEARVGISDAYSVGAVLAAAATGHPPNFGVDGLWTGPREMKDTRITDVIQGLLQKDWRLRLSASQAAEALRGGPMHNRSVAQPFFNINLGWILPILPSQDEVRLPVQSR